MLWDRGISRWANVENRSGRSGEVTCAPGAARGLRTVEARNSAWIPRCATRINILRAFSRLFRFASQISNASRKCHGRTQRDETCMCVCVCGLVQVRISLRMHVIGGMKAKCSLLLKKLRWPPYFNNHRKFFKFM